jgi:hypothetical protein
MGGIALDPTADDDRSVPAQRHITAFHDCLDRRTVWELFPGSGGIFMNPPFNFPHLFIERLAQEVARSGIPAIALCKAGVLHNQKTGAIIRHTAASICHWGSRGRIRFVDPYGDVAARPDFDCVLIYWGHDPARFAFVFRDWGTISEINDDGDPDRHRERHGREPMSEESRQLVLNWLS